MSDKQDAVTDALLATVYDALYALARSRMRREQSGHTLQPTALVNEVYLRLAQDGTRHWANQREFFAAAAEAMRRILIDHARSRSAAKRGTGRKPVPLDETLLPLVVEHGLTDEELLQLHGALDALEVESPRHSLVVKLKYFVGMTAQEIAESVGISVPTVNRDWTMAKAWLRTRMAD